MTLRQWKDEVGLPQLLLRKWAAVRATRRRPRAFAGVTGRRSNARSSCSARAAAGRRRGGRAHPEGRIDLRAGGGAGQGVGQRPSRDLPLGDAPAAAARDAGLAASLERAVAPRAGDVSPVIKMSDGFVLLKCLAHCRGRGRKVRGGARGPAREVEDAVQQQAMGDALREAQAWARVKKLWAPAGGGVSPAPVRGRERAPKTLCNPLAHPPPDTALIGEILPHRCRETTPPGSPTASLRRGFLVKWG